MSCQLPTTYAASAAITKLSGGCSRLEQLTSLQQGFSGAQSATTAGENTVSDFVLSNYFGFLNWFLVLNTSIEGSFFRPSS